MMHRLFRLRCVALIAFLGISLLAAGCDLLGDDEDAASLRTTGVLVGNSGNFADQNGTITLYNPSTEQARTVASLGAFLQAMRQVGDSLYVVTNTLTGGRVEVLDATTLNRTGQVVSPTGTPRALAVVNENTAYVTHTSFTGGDLFVAPYDRRAGRYGDDTIPLDGAPEDVLVAGDRAFVANYGVGGAGTTLTVIDTGAGQVMRTIDLGCDGPNELFLDAQNELVVVCQGKTVYNDDFTEIVEQTNGQVVFVDVSASAVVDRILLDRQVGSTNGTQTAFYAPASEELYAIDGTDTVLRFNTATNTAAGSVAVPSSAGLTGLSAVAYDAATQLLYVGRFAAGPMDGPDYTAAGGVVVLNRDGSEEATFAAGPAPAHIALRQQGP